MSQNAADKSQVKKADDREKFTRRRDLLDVRDILATPCGRRFIWRYLSICGVFKLSFTGNSETFFNEGQRNVGLRLMTDVMDADPTAYVLMQKEAKEEEEKQNG